MIVELAPASFKDWRGLMALLQDAFAYMDGRIDPPSSLHALTEADLQAKASVEHLILAHEHERLLGCAFAAVRDGSVYVGKVAVSAEVRGQGIARQMLEVAVSIALKTGRPCLELQTRVELIENHQAFAALGFKKVSESAHAGYARATSITMQRQVRLRAQ
jgi:predicted GNAT family N-acyltransferase